MNEVKSTHVGAYGFIIKDDCIALIKKARGGYKGMLDIPGGGICQISSTLYNAVLIANLEVTERHPHSHRVYYVPQDKDATIFYGTYDLKFINNTDRDIKIETSNDNANVTINLIKI